MTQERRYARRHYCNFPVTLSAKDQGGHAGVATDVSTLGISIQMARTVVTALAQGGSILTAGDLVTIRLPDLPGGDPEGRSLAAKVGHVRRLSLEEYLVGLRFVEPDGLDEESVMRLVEATG